MAWQRATFKGKQVWIEVGADGAPAGSGGRVAMRYSDRPGSKIYRAGTANVVLDTSSPPVALDAGVSADDAKSASKAGSKAGSRGRGFGSAGRRTDGQKQAAAEAARDLLDELGTDVIIAYTDGGCRGNPGPAGSGVVLQLPGGRRAEASRALGRATNNVAELTAIGMALELLDEAEVPPDTRAAILTDSGYSHGVLVRGWKAKANTELILGLRQRLTERPGVEIHWVAGHVGVAGNERADALANVGVDGVTAKRWLDA
jgi:ribonuclease HI